MIEDKTCPCRECDTRTETCHAACRLYAGWTEEHRKRMTRIKRVKGHEHLMDKVQKDAKKRMVKGIGKRRKK